VSFPKGEFTRTRTYLKQVPGRRLLASMNGELIGHLAIEHRVIGTSAGPASIFGLIDVCVAPRWRGQGIATKLVLWVENLAVQHAIEFLLLFAHDPRVYERSGFRRATNSLRWLKIHEHESLGIGEEPLEELMVKALGPRAWPAGPVDLLGYQF